MQAAGLGQIVGMSPVLSSAIHPEAMFSPSFAHKAALLPYGDSVQKQPLLFFRSPFPSVGEGYIIPTSCVSCLICND